MQTYSLKGVDIFSVGKWNEDTFTQKDLENMVKSFDETKQGVRPYIKLGHDKNQSLAQKDGLPALGWIDRMYIKGDKLIADLVDIPKKVYDLIKIGAYKKVSCEMFFNVKIKDKKFSHLITAVSLLGADTPAVMNLNDIHALYFEAEDKPRVYFEQALEFKYEKEIQGKDLKMSKTENEIKLEMELDSTEKAFTAEKEKADKLAAQANEDAKELATLKEFKANAEKKSIEDAVALKQEQTKTFVTTLVSEKLCTPAMKPLITELLSDKKEFSVKNGEAELKSKEEIIKESLKLFAAAKEINFEESTDEAKQFAAKNDEKAVEDKIAKFMKDDKKMTYKQAYAKAMKKGE